MYKRPVAIDLFAGAGGMSLGFEQAGFDVKAAVEIDPVHCGVHAFNFPDCEVIPKSVASLTGKEIEESIGGKRVDLVIGGAPCQGFSMIGKRVLDDPRNSLVKDFVRIVRELDASYFVFENVKGLTVGRHRKFLDELFEEFEKVGYQVRAPWRVLNAADFGVPQNRERLILMGAKNGLKLPVYPLPTHVRPGVGSTILGDFGPNCRDALDDLPDAEKFAGLEINDSVMTTRWGMPSDYAAELRCLELKHWHFGYRRAWDPELLTSSIRTNHSTISRRRFMETAPGSVEPISRFYRLPPDGLSNTLRAGTDGARGAFTSPRPIHYRHPRCITVREMARLHGFPDWFRLHVTKWHGARQVGNAVPPALARIIGAAVIEAMALKPTRPSSETSLGDEALLRMDLSQASKYWEVERPVSRRNQRSGARKRKQVDIEAERIAAGV
jgi:DNA (cytosine-5)-methyltransferase 1